MASAVTELDKLGEHIPHVASGKVREIYDLSVDGAGRELLFVATDRISAYDVVMSNGISRKGEILTQLSKFWFEWLPQAVPALKTHFIAVDLPEQLRQRLPADTAALLQRRSMVVKKLKPLPIESIVRGYITGSAWVSYQKNGTVCDIPLSPGLQESQKLERPLWTPSTKAAVGEKDENISPEQAARMIGDEVAKQVEDLSLAVYAAASSYAAERGIIIADTKFEWGLDETTTPPSVVLIDEVLTPDSSRFWSADAYKIGHGQDSFDKQSLRDWLVETSQKGKDGVVMPDDVVQDTTRRYADAYGIILGTPWEGE